jgi:sporulation protein YlmC with PRC-barrel domain
MELVRDVLDKQIHDAQGCKIGKVDGIVVVLRKGRAPRLIALELGVVTLASRIHRSLGDWVARLERAAGITKGEPVRILFEHVVKTGIDVDVDIDGKRTGALKWEDWLRKHVIAHLPGSQR